MARSVIVGLVVAMASATGTTAASAQHRDLVIRPGQTRAFTAAHRGDTVSCEGLRLTIQSTPTYAHTPGIGKRLAFHYAYAPGLVLSVRAPEQRLVIATCKRR
jgi:hypothetical protein